MTDDKKKVWVIDDIEAIRRKHALILGEAGFDVREFETVDAAMSEMAYDANTKQCSPPPDLYAVVTDNDTESVYKGMDLLKALKGTSVGRVLITGNFRTILSWTDSQKDVGASAKVVSKMGNYDDSLANTVQQSATEAAMEKIGLSQKSDGRRNS